MKTVLCGVCTMIMAGAAQAQTASSDGESVLDAIVVTGSHIARKTDVPPASPIETLDASWLGSSSASNMATYLKDLPANFGGTFGTGRGVGSDRGTGTVNLRGLGAHSTLILIDGMRSTQVPDAADNVVDVNSLLPEIMLDRIEVVKDGASAIYGSDAVAGVVNFVTKDGFTGIRVDGRLNHFTYSDKGDRRLQTLIGAPLGDRGHFLAAASYMDQDMMMLATDIPTLEGEAYSARWSSPTSWPGIFSVPQRDAAGNLSGARQSVADPLCGQIQGAFPSSGAIIDGAAERLDSAEGATQCRFHFYPEGSAQADMRRFQTYAKFDYDVSDSVTLNATMAYNTTRVLSSYTSGATASFPNLVVPGHNPGNPFRAVNENGDPLYAVSSGVSAGYSRDGAEVFLPARDAAGNVILTANPTDPSSGIPFFEDLGYTGRGIGSQGGLPTNNEWDQPGYSLSRLSRTDLDIFRTAAALSGGLTADWTWSAGANYSRYNLASNGEVGQPLQQQMRLALQGLGGTDCTGDIPGQGGCEYYNIFGNSVFATGEGDPRANSQSIIDYVFPMQLDRYTSDLLVLEGMVSGTLFELPAGLVGVALGYQSRRAGLRVDYDTNKNIRNTARNTVSYDFNESRTTHAGFAEAIVPVFDSEIGFLELNVALRHETASNFSSTDPKLGFTYSTANDMLTLRGTYGTSFVAPSLYRMYAVSGGGGAINDVCDDPVCTGTLNQVITSQTQGNPDLRPESAETTSVGFILRPVADLSIAVDWWRYKFEDRIATEAPQQVLNMDPDGSLTGRVIRGDNGQVLQIHTQYFNAPAVITEGLDFAAAYNLFMGEAGDLAATLSATYVPTYKWQLEPGGAYENYAGQENQARSGAAAASPKWRGNLNVMWNLDNHSINGRVNYIGGFVFNKDGRLSQTLNPDHKVEAWATLDLTYTYRLSDRLTPGFADGLSLSVGAVNVLNSAIPELPAPASQKFIGNLYDIRGRMVWLGVTADF